MQKSEIRKQIEQIVGDYIRSPAVDPDEILNVLSDSLVSIIAAQINAGNREQCLVHKTPDEAVKAFTTALEERVQNKLKYLNMRMSA